MNEIEKNWVKENFKDFIIDFVDYRTGKNSYFDQINSMCIESITSFIVNFEDLIGFNPKLAELFLVIPEESVQIAKEILIELLKYLDEGYLEEKHKENFHVRISNIPMKSEIFVLEKSQIGHLISIQGKISKMSNPEEILLIGVFRCDVCEKTVSIKQEIREYREPRICMNPLCGNRSFTLVDEESIFIDYCEINIQQRRKVFSNKYPVADNLSAHLIGDIARAVNKGDKIIATGILRMKPKHKKMKGKTPVFEKHLEVSNIEKLEG